MKLLAIEARQFKQYYRGRYEQVAGFGADLFVLNGIGEEGFWPAGRYRIAGSQHIDDIIGAAKAWHAVEHFDGVFTFAEQAVVAVAAIAEALGLPGVGVDAARKSRNKFLMREAYRLGGVPSPRFRFVAGVAEAHAAAREFGYPVVLKPTLGTASNYVFRVDSPAEMDERYATAADAVPRILARTQEAEGLDLGPEGLLVESFLDGREHLFEALVWDGEVYLGSAVDRITAEGDTFDDDVHRAPTALSDAQLAEVQRITGAVAKAHGLRRSVMHVEIRYHRDAPHVVETAIRPGGGALDLVAQVTADYSPIEAVMDVARGVRPKVRHYQPTGVYMMGTCLICEGGQLEYATMPPEVSESEHTLYARITAQPGDIIRRPPEGNNILGFLVVTGSSAEDVQRRLEEFAAKIDVKMAGKPLAKTLTPWERLTPAP